MGSAKARTHVVATVVGVVAIGRQPSVGWEQVRAKFGHEMSVFGGSAPHGTVDVAGGGAERRCGQCAQDRALRGGLGQSLETTGESGGVRVRDQVVGADTDGHDRCGVGQMIEQRQLFIDHVGAVSAAAAQVDDRMGPPASCSAAWRREPSRDRCSKLRCPAPSSRPGRPTVADDGHPRPLRGSGRRVHASAVRSGRWSLTPSGSCR